MLATCPAALSPSSLDEGEEESSPNSCPPLATPPTSPRKLAPTSQRRKRRTVYTAGKFKIEGGLAEKMIHFPKRQLDIGILHTLFCIFYNKLRIINKEYLNFALVHHN